MGPISPVKLQSLEYDLGNYLAMRYCAPLAFFMLLRAAGYIRKDLMPGSFCKSLDREALTTTSDDWSRPALTNLLRKQYKVAIVSWVINGEQIYGGIDLDQMKKAGYLTTKKETEFFLKEVQGKTIEDIVKSGYPVVVTMKPGFGHEEGKNIHAVIIARWEDTKVKVIDPDARNNETEFDPEYIRNSIDDNGAGSIVLPKT